MDKKRKRLLNAASVLPLDLYSVIALVPDLLADKVQEVSLRANRPLCIECNDKRYYFTQNRCITNTILDQQMVIVTPRALFDTFQNICNYSVYSRQNEINNGYITLKGGHRAGVCGTAVINEGNIVNVKDITSINIRVAREVLDCSKEFLSKVDVRDGVLICGAPCSGKTTIIRDIARVLSYDYKVSLIDERNELSANVNGVFQNDIGMCDVYDSYKKSDAIIQAVRSMSPEIIVCDEVSTLTDVEAVAYGVNSGVSFILTIHADNENELIKRPIARKLLDTHAISTAVFLESRKNVGKIKSVISVDEMLGDKSA